jgi:hypothetical protein
MQVDRNMLRDGRIQKGIDIVVFYFVQRTPPITLIIFVVVDNKNKF